MIAVGTDILRIARWNVRQFWRYVLLAGNRAEDTTRQVTA